MRSDDLLAAVFPDQAACGENLVVEPRIPDDPLVNFGSEFGALEKRLRDRVVERMDAEHEVLKRAAIFNFPQQFAGIKGLLGGFLEPVFCSGGPSDQRPVLRGVCFTAGPQY